MFWRDKLRPIISEVIEANRGKSIKEIRKALRAAYPFSRKYGPKHQYKIWCDEINKQLGLYIKRPPRPKIKDMTEEQIIEDRRQIDLF